MVLATWTLFCVFVSAVCGSFDVSWGLYRWVYNQKSAFQPMGLNSLEFSHPSVPNLSIRIQTLGQMTQQYNIYNASSYQVEEDGKITVKTSGKSLLIELSTLQQASVAVKCSNAHCKELANQIFKQLGSSQSMLDNCKSIEENQYSCSIPNGTLKLKATLDAQKRQAAGPQQSQNFLESARNMIRFMKTYNISMQQLKAEMVKVALTSLMNSICLFEYDQRYYLGFCEMDKNKKWTYNFKLAAFSIYLMADYFYGLAETIYRDFFTLTETKLLYPTKVDSQVLPLPEHIEIFTRFGEVLGLQNEAQLLNSLFVVPMLNQLGTLHEQLNYREAKKFHPLLLKMLGQKWSSSSPKSTIKSIYEQSFTEDFKYHDYGQRLEQSIAKNAWIFKVIDTYTALLIKHHTYYMPVEQIKQTLQEQFTLLNIYKLYANDENNAKFGKYKDIVDVGENLKLYSRYSGYDAILPYVYGLGKVYPEATIKQLETNFGLKSSNQPEKEQYEKKYRYRGDIHAYFNAKLLTVLAHKVEEDKTITPNHKKQITAHLNKISTNVGTKIMNNYKSDKKIYTSWTTDGKGRQSCDWLQIVSILFLKWV